MSTPKPQILFAEDHDDTRELISLVLQQSGFEVVAAATVCDTLKLARRGNFDLFIFDSVLADGSAIDLCKQIRALDQRTPILFYSGLAQEKDKSLALSSGVQTYLVKPVEIPELLRAVRELMTMEVRAISQWDSVNSSSLTASSTSF